MQFPKWGIAIAIFAIAALFFCYPQLSGNLLYQNDTVQWQYNAHEGIAYHDSTGRDVLWLNNMYGGMPSFTTYTGVTNTNYPWLIQAALQLIGKPAYFFFIYFLGFYVLLLALKVDKWLGVVGALAYGFATFNVVVIAAGHETQALSLGYLPAALAGLILIYKGRWLPGAAIYGIALCLVAANGHYQIMFYAASIFLFFIITKAIEAFRKKQIPAFVYSSLICIGITVLAFLPSLPSVMATREYSAYTMRGGKSELTNHEHKVNGGLDKATAFAWSSTIGESLVGLVPYLYGGSSYEPAENAPETAAVVGNTEQSVPLYWGPQPLLQGPFYFGCVSIFLFILAMMVVPGVHKWWMLAVSILGYALSWGSNFQLFNYWMFDHVPLLNMFRAVTMAKIIPQLMFPLLGMLALQQLLQPECDKKKVWRYVLIAGGVTAGACLIIALGGAYLYKFSTNGESNFQEAILTALQHDRINIARKSALQSTAVILIACGLIWAYLKEKLKALPFVAILGLVMVADLVSVSHNYLNDSHYLSAEEYADHFKPRDVDLQILKDKDPYYRVLDLTTNPFMSAMPSYFHRRIGGNNPALMEKYNDLIQRQMINGMNEEVVNMLNVKYFILRTGQDSQFVQRNNNARGNGWFVHKIQWAATDEEVMAHMDAVRLGDTTKRVIEHPFRADSVAILRTTYQPELAQYHFGKDSSASIAIYKYGLDEITYQTNNSQDGLAVFSDIYYPAGWKAYIDGKETTIYNANYVLRALKIPTGKHFVTFTFKPESFYRYRPVALAGSIGLMLLLLTATVAGILEMKSKKVVETTVPNVPTETPAKEKNMGKIKRK